MTNKDEELKKKEAIAVARSVINIPKYKVVGHESGKIIWSNEFENDDRYNTTIERPPKNATSMMVIYLQE